MPHTKSYKLGELFTEKELGRALQIIQESAHPTSPFVTNRILAEVVRPAMPYINKATGMENDPKYWAYALQYVLSTA